MRGKGRKVSMIVAAVAVIAISLWFVQHVRDRHKAAERESGYHTVLAQYVVELKPGMNRDQVERYLQTDGKRFKQMCCVANFKGQYVSFDGAGYDDLVKIAEECVFLLKRSAIRREGDQSSWDSDQGDRSAATLAR
jgi:hypothetical protein